MTTSRRALLGLPLVAALAGCGTGGAPEGAPATDLTLSVAPGLTEPPSPTDIPPPTPSQTPPPSPTGPGEWADADTGQCVTLVEGFRPDEAIDLLCGRHAPRFATFQQAGDWAARSADYTRIVGWAGRVGAWTMLWEENGYAGSLPEVTQRLSRQGASATAYWDENVGTGFVLARSGRVVRVIGPDHPWGDQGAPLPQERGLGLAGPDFPTASTMLRLLVGVTGTPVVEAGWRDRPGLLVFGDTL